MLLKRSFVLILIIISILFSSNCIYAEDSLDNLFTDFTHTEVSSEWTLEEIETKYKEPNQNGSTLNDLKRALSVKSGAVKSRNDEFFRSTSNGSIEKTGDIKGHVRNDLNLDNFGTNFQPMGLNAKSGSVIKVFAENLPNNTTVQVAFEQILSDHWKEWYFKGKTYLHNGENTIVVPSYRITAPDGAKTEPTINSPMIYISCPYNETELPNEINLYFEGVNSHPVFRMDKGENPEEFKQKLRKQVDKVNNNPENTLDVVELVSQHTIMAVTATRADELLSQANYDVVRSLKAWDHLFDFMFKFDGIETESDPLIQKAKEYFTLVQLGHGAEMYTGEEYIGVHAKTGGEDTLIDCYGGGNKSNIGWGLSHEVGHALDNNERKLGECTNNMFANAYHTWVNKDPNDGSVNPKNDRNKKHLEKVQAITDPNFEKGSIWSTDSGKLNYLVFSLLESYHPGYWGQLDSYFRDPSNKAKLAKLANQNERIVYISSKILNCDLGYWFEDFGIRIGDKATAFNTSNTSNEYQKLMQELRLEDDEFRTDEIPFWYLDIDQYMLAYEHYDNQTWGNLYGKDGQLSHDLAKPIVSGNGNSWKIMMSDKYDKQRLLYEVAIKENDEYKSLGTTTSEIFTVSLNPSEDNLYVRALDRKLNWSNYTLVDSVQETKPVYFDSQGYDDLTKALEAAINKGGNQTIEVRGDTTLSRYPKNTNGILLYYVDIPVENDTEKRVNSITINPVGNVTVHSLEDEVFKINNATLKIGNDNGTITFSNNEKKNSREEALFNLGENGKLELENVIFNNWTARLSSAVINTGNNVKGVSLNNCEFNNCGSYKGVIFSNDNLSAITNDYKTIELTNCNFNNCYTKESSDYGVVTNRNGVIDATSCTFTSCSGINGGAIWSSAKTSLTNCNFINCRTIDFGGAVYISDTSEGSNVNKLTTINGGSFKNCDSSRGSLIAVKGSTEAGTDELLKLEDIRLNNGEFGQDDLAGILNNSTGDLETTENLLYISLGKVTLSGSTDIKGNTVLSKGALQITDDWTPCKLNIKLESAEPGQKLVYYDSSKSSSLQNYFDFIPNDNVDYVNSDGAFELKQTEEHNISFDINGGNWIGEAQETLKYKESVLTKLPTNVEKGNQKFVGWFKNGNFEGSSVREVGLPGDACDLKLKAKWSGEDPQSCKHEWSNPTEKLIVEASCSQQGYKTLTKTCNKCQLEQIEEQYTAKTNHQFGESKVESKPATCTEYGTKTTTRVCTICNYPEITTETVSPTGHSWGDWRIITNATTTSSGTKEHTCSKCGQRETQIIPATGSQNPGGGGSSGGGSGSGGGSVPPAPGGGGFGPIVPSIPPTTDSGNKDVEVKGISVSPTTGSIEVGSNLQLKATVTPDNATDKSVTWKSADSSVATVSQSGLVTAKSSGTVKITVETKDGKHSAVCTITVKAKQNTDTPSSKPENPSQPTQPTQPTEPSQPAQSNIPIYRLYNEANNEHLYTSDANEVRVLVASDWKDEGTGWNAPTTGEGVYRLYSPVTNEHHYTKDVNEVLVLKNSGWSVDNSEKPLFYSGGSKSVYRLYHEGTRRHHLTTDENEYNTLGSGGWNREGIALYSLS